MKRHTKIVCTLGPAVNSLAQIKLLVKEGMSMARLNCSHGDWDSKREMIEWVQTATNGSDPVAILADLQGPKFRLGVIENDKIAVTSGQILSFGADGATLPVPSKTLLAEMRVGDRVLLGDGYVELKLVEEAEGIFQAKVLSNGDIKTKQGITVAGRSFSGPAITTKDLQDIQEAIAAGVDYIALSYVRTAADMRELRAIVDKMDPGVKLVAKIETREALKDIENIVKLSDAIMVARGDLGLQMEIEDVPAAQKRIIHKSNLAGKPVITATQMLESMITNIRPTRAEASDVANAILDGTDAVMLSGETASGAYPIESVRIMAKIAEKTEPLYTLDPEIAEDAFRHSSTDIVANAAVDIADALKTKAILTLSTSGLTPRMVAKYRPKNPIICACWNPRVQRQLAICRGVQTITVNAPATTDDAIRSAVNSALRSKLLKVGQQIVVTAGVPVGQPGNTNLISVLTV